MNSSIDPSCEGVPAGLILRVRISFITRQLQNAFLVRKCMGRIRHSGTAGSDDMYELVTGRVRVFIMAFQPGGMPGADPA